MSELNEATRTLEQFCNPHGFHWHVARPPNDELWSVLIDYNHGSYERRGENLIVVTRDAIAGVQEVTWW